MRYPFKTFIDKRDIDSTLTKYEEVLKNVNPRLEFEKHKHNGGIVISLTFNFKSELDQFVQGAILKGINFVGRIL